MFKSFAGYWNILTVVREFSYFWSFDVGVLVVQTLHPPPVVVGAKSKNLVRFIRVVCDRYSFE